MVLHECEYCAYFTNKKSNYNRHLKTHEKRLSSGELLCLLKYQLKQLREDNENLREQLCKIRSKEARAKDEYLKLKTRKFIDEEIVHNMLLNTLNPVYIENVEKKYPPVNDRNGDIYPRFFMDKIVGILWDNVLHRDHNIVLVNHCRKKFRYLIRDQYNNIIESKGCSTYLVKMCTEPARELTKMWSNHLEKLKNSKEYNTQRYYGAEGMMILFKHIVDAPLHQSTIKWFGKSMEYRYSLGW